MANRTVNFQIEGYETEEWKDEYINGQSMNLKSTIKNKDKVKRDLDDDSSDEGLWNDNGSEDWDSCSDDSAENFSEMLMHENKLSKQYWLP